MSRRPCSCSLRPLSGSCRCSYGALTAAGRPCPSDGCKEESSTLSVKMKCDFNYNHVHSGIKPVKPDDSRRKGSYTTAYLEGSYKDCIKDYDRVSVVGSPVVSPRIVELEPESKPLHNKENQHIQQTLDSSNNIQELENSGYYEDSGYSSFSQRSGLSEHEDSSLALVESCNDSPQCCLLRTQSPDQYPNKNLLPALHFEKVVCSTLKKNCKRNPKIDWEKLKEFISSGNFRLQNIIGRKMGLECVDILSELFRRGLKHLLANILTQLSEMDLINVSKVSTTWKKILEDDKVALQLYNKAIQRITEKNIKFSPHASTREYVLFRTPLASVQKSATQTLPKKDARTKLPDPGDQKHSTYSRHSEFSEVAKTLKKNESLKACIRCQSPAKYDCYLQRATCKRESCGFDYCTKCLCTYHTTEDCSNGKPLKASYKMGPVPGTKKSKKNLRRL
ncbi:F-box only protein 5 isoform X1 [Bubalus kerabau]|uniref:F-box only protein 5 isoform X1 n=1 Tax=Bubalus bubalis TaxID=89462 RepID=UPI00042CFB23|nr:F-box only protein 5 isoform X1 [Bubalus bubalis]XP_055391988.1 F-box only protein 5 isoform X1 [Bubalus carabanensis]